MCISTYIYIYIYIYIVGTRLRTRVGRVSKRVTDTDWHASSNKSLPSINVTVVLCCRLIVCSTTQCETADLHVFWK